MKSTQAEVIEHETHLVPWQVSSAITPMAMLDRALAQGSAPEVIAKLMDLSDRWGAGQARKAFDRALAAAKAELPVIIKNSTGHNAKKYADFAAIARVVDPIIGKHGLSYRFRTVQDSTIRVTCILSHEDGHYEENTLAGPADKTGNKNEIQAIGSTLTYLQRYSLVQALGLAAADDDDGKAAAKPDCITQEQADTIRDVIEASNAPRDKFLKWAKVDRIEDLRAEFYESALAAVQKYGAKS